EGFAWVLGAKHWSATECSGYWRLVSMPSGPHAQWTANCTLSIVMRSVVILALILTLNTYATTPKQRHPYRTQWKHATVGKGALARVGAGAAVSQVRRSPRKWGGGAAGFGKRLEAGAATHAV